MIRLQVLGPLHVADDAGRSVRALLAQPKRLALLIHLAVAGGFRRRDQLLAMFWPELDTTHARGALSQALRFLRRELGSAQVIVNRGAEEIGVDAATVWCDAVAMSAALRERRYVDALELYGGDLLDGFHVVAGPEFEEWVAREREGLRAGAARAASALAAEREVSGDVAGAVASARRALELSQRDERSLRDLLELLGRVGDRAGALQAYQAFAERMAHDLDASPSAETVAVIERIRATPRARPAHVAEADVGGAAPLSDASDQPRKPSVTSRRRSRVALRVAAGVVTFSVMGVVAAINVAPATARVAVRPFYSATRDPAFSEGLGSAISDSIAVSIAAQSAVKVVPLGESETRRRYTIGGSYRAVGDSLEFTIEITDQARNRLLPPPEPVRVSSGAPLDAVDVIRERALGALEYYTSAFGVDSTFQRRPPPYAAYVALVDGLKARRRGDWTASEAAMRRAIAVDSLYTQAWYMLASALGNLGGRAQARGGIVGRFEAIDSLARAMRRVVTVPTPADRATLQYLERYAAGDFDGALEATQALGDVIPFANYSTAFLGILTNRPSVGLRGLAKLRPGGDLERDVGLYWTFLTATLHQAGRYDEELRAARRGRERSPRSLILLNAELRARIGLGDVEDLSPQDLPPLGVLRVALELRAHGHAQRASQWLKALVDSAPKASIPFPDRLWVGMALLALDRLPEATTLLEESVQLDSLALDQRGMLGTAYARRGMRAEALRISSELESVREPYLQGLPTLWRAKIAARLGDPATATRLLAQAFDEGVIYHLNYPSQRGAVWHSDPDFEPLRGYRAFEELTRPK